MDSTERKAAGQTLPRNANDLRLLVAQKTAELGETKGRLESQVKELERSEAEREQLLEHTKRLLERMNALSAVSLAVTSTLDLRVILDILTERICLLIPNRARQ